MTVYATPGGSAYHWGEKLHQQYRMNCGLLITLQDVLGGLDESWDRPGEAEKLGLSACSNCLRKNNPPPVTSTEASPGNVSDLQDNVLQFDGKVDYLVGWIGWGTVEEDLYMIGAASIEDAIDGFLAACRDGDFIGHGAREINDRTIWPDTTEHILVYAMVELGQYRRVPQWEKVK